LALRKIVALPAWSEMRPLAFQIVTNKLPPLPNARMMPLLQTRRIMSVTQGSLSGFGGIPFGAIINAEIHRRLLLCALSLERYHLKHGTIPPSLTALIPDFFAWEPLDPLDGKPIRYRQRLRHPLAQARARTVTAAE